MKWIKKIMEAKQLTFENQAEIKEWCNGKTWSLPPMRAVTGIKFEAAYGMDTASFGDWIIKDENGFWPCKPDIFEKTYESASLPSSSVTREEEQHQYDNGEWARRYTTRQEFPQSPSDILKKYSDSRFNISIPFSLDMLYNAMEDYANQFKTNPVIITNISNGEDVKFMPPDNGDICWEVGSKTFTRKEVAYLLYTQRAMISNDLKYHCGDNLTSEMFEILDNPRKPIY